MILFKRVGSAFRGIKQREWMLLALETIGVLAGILIAFELNEWSGRRAEDRRVHRQLERLFDEAQQDVAAALNLADVMGALAKGETRFAAQVSQGACPPADKWRAVGSVSMMPASAMPHSVYDEMMGSGGLSMLPTRQLRSAISLFHQRLDWFIQQNDYFRMVAKPPVADDDPRMTLTFVPTAEEQQSASYDRTALCADRGFRNRMVSAARNHAVLASYHQDVAVAAIAMCLALADALERPTCEPAWGRELEQSDIQAGRQLLGTLDDQDG